MGAMFPVATARRARRIGRVGAVLAVCIQAAVGFSPGRAGAAGAPAFVSGITCVGTNFCFAVGGIFSGQPFIASSGGDQWSRSKVPSVAGGSLASVSCSSKANCFAVGKRGSLHDPATLILRWNGTAWKVSPSPSRGSSSLTGISCPTAKVCLAVGSSIVDGRLQTLVVRWNGTAWKIVPSPSGPSEGELYGISCVSSTSCFAVGTTLSAFGDGTDTLILRWNGATWSISARQRAGGTRDLLESVSCVRGSSLCMAVGGAHMDVQAMVLRDQWNGKAWRAGVVTRTTADFELNGVSCLTATSCLAVGSRNFENPYAEQWNGSKWTATASPSFASGTGLMGVACVGPKNCFAVGGSTIQHWDGSWVSVADFS